MKQFFRRLPVKIVCFILCIISLSTAILSITGAVVLSETGFYNFTAESMLSNELYKIFDQESGTLMHAAINYVNGYTVSALENNSDYSVKATNLRFQVYDPDGNIIYRNTKEPLEQNNSQWEYYQYFQITFDDTGNIRYLDYLGQKPPFTEEPVYSLYAYLDPEMNAEDNFLFYYELIDLGYSLRYVVYPLAIVSLLLTVFCFVSLMCTAGKRVGSEEISPGLLHMVPSDLILVLGILAVALGIGIFFELFYGYDSTFAILAGSLLSLLLANIFLGLCIFIATRLKNGTLFSNTLIMKCCRLLRKSGAWLWKKIKTALHIIKELFFHIPLIWRTLLIFCGISFLEFLIIIVNLWSPEYYMGFLIIEKLILCTVILYIALTMRKLEQGGKALAAGDLSYQVDTKSMFRDFKQHGENLNSIAAGMAVAVEERLQSERMKTELITNVSHDIKTPLTSIINYAGLIEEEKCDCEHHQEYSSVLIRKSVRLKQLLDDLVEVSKAATGNLEILLAPCEAGVLLTQVAGEFEQRCEAAGLQLVTRQPGENLQIMADSRRIWRVFENLMSNACKYSLPGSRVYLTLERLGNDAVFTFRNTSATALDITPEALMERFVRGDSSRSTEGNGLGLSIAGSLTELQNGKMEISIDGDLFKVCVKFPTLA